MAAGLLLRRAAGMKNRGAFFRRKAGQLEFLECNGWHGRNLRPLLHRLRGKLAGQTNFVIGGVIFELKREKFQCERAKFRFLEA